LGAGFCQWRPNKDELLLTDEKHLKSFAAASGWRETKEWTVNDIEPQPVFSPDGAEIVYSDSVPSGRVEYGYPVRNGRLCRLAPHTPAGSPQVLFSESDTREIPCLWTRYGSILFYKDPGFGVSIMNDGLELFSLPAAGGRPRSLRITTLVNDNWFSLSPTHDAVAICIGEGRETYVDKRIAILDLKSSAVRYVTDPKTAAITPAWSPDGKWIAYCAAPEGWSSNETRERLKQLDQLVFRRRIWLADPAGAQAPRRLTGDDRYRDEEPMWSADGQHILFCRVDGAKQRTLWVMRADGTAPAKVAAGLYPDPAEFGDEADSYGYLYWPEILDVHAGNHVWSR
jgi:hypothetical protein